MTSMEFEESGLSPVRPVALPPRVVNGEKTRRPNYFKRAVAALAGTAVAATTVWGLYENGRRLQDGRDNKLALFQSMENTDIANARVNPVKSSENVIILKGGVVYRKTPDLVNGNTYLGLMSLHGNVAGTIPKGHEQILVHPRILTDSGHSTWLGFTFEDGTKSDQAESVSETADQTYWVDASKLATTDAQIASRNSNKIYDFSVATLVAHEQTALQNDHGQYISETGNPLAWAPTVLTYEIAHRAEHAE